MDIKEKMTLCFNEELLNNKILTENEKKVLASLMYSYKICSKSKDNTIIRAMNDLRKDIKISNNAMYDAIRSLESLYHMIERTAGESRGKEKSSIASKFKLNFDVIFNPPKEPTRFDFTKEIKSSETSINTIDTDIETDIDIDINKDTNIGINTIIDKNINNDIDENIETNVVFENEISNNIIHDDNTILNNIFVTQKELKKMEIDEINKKYEIEEGIRQWTQEINNRLYDN